MEITSIFSTAYFPPVNYFLELIKSDNIIIESHEHYIRQTYRNRCQILSCNGVLNLSYPVIHVSGSNEIISETEIDYKTNWKKNHSFAIKSAYGKSPYFNYFADALLEHLSDNNEKYLLDFNTKILNSILSIIKIKKQISFTNNFQKQYPEQIKDHRFLIHPKKESNSFENKPYLQTFSDRFGFTSNLSILDLIFNLGPDSKQYLEK